MAITYVGGSAKWESAGSPGTIDTDLSSLDSGTISADDVAILTVMHDSGTVTDVTQTGGDTFTQIHFAVETGGRDSGQAIFYRKLTGSEGTVTFETTGDTGLDERSIVVSVYRGVDTTTQLDVTWNTTNHYVTGTNDANGANKAITTATDGAFVVLSQCVTHDEITTVGAPSGYTLGPDITGASGNWAQQVHAYKEVTTAGTETPGDWTHTLATTVAEARRFTIALKPAAGSGTQTITLDPLSPVTLPSPTLSVGAVTITLDPLTPVTLADPTLDSLVTVTLDPLSPVTLPLPTLSVGSVAITLDPLQPVTLPLPTVTPAALTIQLDPLTPVTLALPTVSAGTVTVTLDPLAPVALALPTVSLAGSTQTINMLVLQPAQLADPTASAGAYTATLDPLVPTTLPDIALSTIVTATLDALSPVLLADPTVTAGSVTIQLDPLTPAVLATFTISDDQVTVAIVNQPYLLSFHVQDIV